MRVFGIYSAKIKELSRYLSAHKNRVFEYPSDSCFEITLLQGLLICVSKESSLEEKEKSLWAWLASVDNWAHCDMVFSRLKCKQNERRELFSYALRLMKDGREFFVRCGILILMENFTDECTEEVFRALDEITYGKYYVDMAVAWLLSVALINHKYETLEFINNSAKINNFTKYKALQKARESYRIPQNDKVEYKEFMANFKKHK